MHSSKVSVIIVTYNHFDYLKDCINSIDDDVEIVLVDNNSEDETENLIKNRFPKVKLIKSQENLGFGAGVNLGVKNSEGDYLVVVNPDTRFEKESIQRLIEPLKNNGNLVTIPKVLFYDGSKINTCGNIEHFTGLSFTRGLGDGIESYDISCYVCGLSGACFALKKKKFFEIGGFNEKFFIYMEDTELSWRINSYGLKIFYVPDSIVYHDYDLKVTPEKIYFLEKGRYIILRKYLGWIEYLMLSPSLLMTEILTWGFSILQGPAGIKYKFLAIIDGFKVEVVKKEVNRMELLKTLDCDFPVSQLNYNFIDIIVKKFAKIIYKLNYKLIE